jgi:hypothetical protein
MHRLKKLHARNRGPSIRPGKVHHERVKPRPVILRVSKLRCNIVEDRRKGFLRAHIDSANAVKRNRTAILLRGDDEF